MTCWEAADSAGPLAPSCITASHYSPHLTTAQSPKAGDCRLRTEEEVKSKLFIYPGSLPASREIRDLVFDLYLLLFCCWKQREEQRKCVQPQQLYGKIWCFLESCYVHHLQHTVGIWLNVFQKLLLTELMWEAGNLKYNIVAKTVII